MQIKIDDSNVRPSGSRSLPTRTKETRSLPLTPQATREKHEVCLIRSDLLIPGRGDPIKHGALAIQKDKIVWVGSSDKVPKEYTIVEETQVPVLMPGMWDCHVHFGGLATDGSFGAQSPYLPNFNALAGAITVDDMKRTLMAGITSVRDLEGFGADIWPGVEKGLLVGPNIYGSVAALSITGGHGDNHLENIETVLAGARGDMAIGICDGVEDCIRVVRTIIRRGARVIKVCSSGGVLSLNDDPEDQQFSDAELKAIVEEAGRSRRAVAAHAIGKSGIMAALHAGVKSIEHGMFLDEEAADLMLEKDAVLVPTQHVLRTMMDRYFDSLPEPSQKKLLRVSAASEQAYKIALKKGVRVAMGTDTMSSDKGSPLSHGRNVNEVRYAVELGMSPLQAIEMATANGPYTLGRMAPLSGQLKEGYDADVIAIDADPLDDIAVLADGHHITHVWKGGKLFKSPA